MGAPHTPAMKHAKRKATATLLGLADSLNMTDKEIGELLDVKALAVRRWRASDAHPAKSLDDIKAAVAVLRGEVNSQARNPEPEPRIVPDATQADAILNAILRAATTEQLLAEIARRTR